MQLLKLAISGQYTKNIQDGQYLTIGKIIPINFPDWISYCTGDGADRREHDLNDRLW